MGQGARAGSGARQANPPRSAAVYRRRRLVVGFLGVVVLTLVAVFAGLIWPGFLHAEEPEPVPTVTVTAPAPTPTVKSMKRADDETAFQRALPSSVLRFALADIEETDAKDELDATEGWRATYGDGSGHQVTVDAAQWASTQEAESAAEVMIEEVGDVAETGEVKVADDVVGEYALAPVDGGERTITWWNGTVVLRATGPADAIVRFYQAFPL